MITVGSSDGDVRSEVSRFLPAACLLVPPRAQCGLTSAHLRWDQSQMQGFPGYRRLLNSTHKVRHRIHIVAVGTISRSEKSKQTCTHLFARFTEFGEGMGRKIKAVEFSYCVDLLAKGHLVRFVSLSLQ